MPHKDTKYTTMTPKYFSSGIFDLEDGGDDSTFVVQSYSVPSNRPVRIYCDGVYDLFHYGHARSLEQAKKLFPSVYLMAGVTNDKITYELKGKTVMNEKERAESLRHCKYVDEVITDAPWIITEEFLEDNQIDFVAHDSAPYKHGEEEDIYKRIKEKGIFIPIRRTLGISTSGIISKMIKEYDTYVRRNLERGVTAKELNVSFLDLNRIRARDKFRKMNKDIKKKIEEIRVELSVATSFWEKFSNEIISRFMEKFNRNQSRKNILKKIIEMVKK